MKPGRQPLGLFRVSLYRSRRTAALVLPLVSLSLLLAAFPASSFTEVPPKAPKLYEEAVHLRTLLEGKPKRLRTVTDYLKVVNRYRSVYHQFPSSSKADDALLAVAELYQLMAIDWKDASYFRQAIQAYAFLEREYPASPYGVESLFAAAEIFLNDLKDPSSAQRLFKDLVKRYPYSKRARNARARLDDLRTSLSQAKRPNNPEPPPASGNGLPVATPSAQVDVATSKPTQSEARLSAKREEPTRPAEENSAPDVQPGVKPSAIDSIRFWNTEDYTRLVIDTGQEVKYLEGHLDNPPRVFLDIQNARLSSALAARSFVLNDGFLNKIRFGQSKENVARVVLDMASFKSCRVVQLSNPARIVVDIRGAPRTTSQARAGNPGWKLRHGEPLADEWSLVEPQQKSVSGALREESTSAVKVAGPIRNDSAQAEQRANKPSAETTPTTGGSTPAIAAGASAEKDSKSVARSSAPKSDGTRSLTRMLGLKVGRIVIDPGHGGHDTGTIGPSGLQEKDLVLDIAVKLKALLEERLGSDVLLTRTDDTFVPLEERTAMANESQADLFLSIHANSSRNRRVSGVETFFLDFASSVDAEEVAARENSSAQKTIFELQDLVQKITLKEKIEESRELAQIIQKSVMSQLQKSHRQARDRGVKQAPFIVLIGANMPSILSEVSFVSNPSDEKLLRSSSYRQKLAEALCRGVEVYAEALGGIRTARNLP